MLSVIVLLIGILLMGERACMTGLCFREKSSALSDFKAELFCKFIHLVSLLLGQWLPNGQDRRHRKTTLAP